MINVTATISLLELIWVLIGNIGLAAHISLFLRYLVDRKLAVKHHAQDCEVAVANSGLRAQFNYALAQLGMVSLGINAMLIPPIPYVPSINSTVGGLIFIVIELLLIANGLLDNRDKNRLVEMMKKEELNVAN